MNRRTIVDAKAFSSALDHVSKVLQKSSIPVLSEVLVHCSGDHCTLIATNLDTWLMKEIPANGDEFAFVFCRTKEVAKACRYFNGALELSFSDTGEGRNRSLKLTLRNGTRSGEFETMDAEDYPVMPQLEPETAFVLNAAALSKRVTTVSYAAAKQESTSRPSASCIQCTGNLVFALDGCRMACDVDHSIAFPKPFMASEDAMSYLKLFGNQEVTVELGERYGRFTDGVTTVIFRTPGKDFFKAADAVPKQFKEEFFVSTKSLLDELKYLKEFAVRERRPYVRFSGGNLFMPVTNGKYSARVDVSGTSTITFAFDLHKMMDAIRQFKDEREVKIKVTSPVSPIVVEAEGRNDFALICTVKLTDQLMAA